MASAIVCGVHTPADARVVRYAAQLARRLELRLWVLHISEPGELPDDRLLGAIEDIARLQLGADDIAMYVAAGEPDEELMLAARGAALLVVGDSRSNLISEALHGSVTGDVMRAPASPVIVVPRDGVPDRTAGGVTCGVRDRGDVACASVAARLAASLGGPLRLVHVVKPVVVGVSGPAVAPPVAEDAVEGARELLAELSTALAEGLAEPPRTSVLTGPPGPELARAAAEDHAALLAVGASDRGPFAAAVTAAASRYATCHSACPVLVCPRGELL